MSQFQFHFPTIAKCGAGLADQAGALLKPYVDGTLLVVTDQGLIDAGILAGFFASLEQAGIDYQLFSAVEANPSTDVLDAA
ncbi:alcohol dehydrogenase, partial [Pseudomonas plecoglossicida]